MIRRCFMTGRVPGTLVTWGDGLHTCLGHPTNGQLFRPKRVADVSAVDVFAGPRHTLVLTPAATLLSFGDNEYGQLGNGKEKDVTGPQTVVELKNVKTAACGTNYSLAVTQEGDLYEWGYAGVEPGFLSRLFRRKVPTTHINSVPRLVDSLRSAAVSDVAAGEFHFLALTQTGSVYAWGDNEFGQIGNGELFNRIEKPLKLKFFDQLPDGDKVSKVFACGSSSCALTVKGALYVWGKNEAGQLAVATEEEDYKNRYVIERLPTKLPAVSPSPVTEVSMGQKTIVLLCEDGSVFIAGMSIWTHPFRVGMADKFQVVSVAAGGDFFAFVEKQGKVVTYGGPFTGEDRKTEDLPDGMSVISKEFFGESVMKLVGPYDYCAAIINTR